MGRQRNNGASSQEGRRPEYRKAKLAIAHLKELYIKESRRKYPSIPEFGRATPVYKANTTNSLIRCVIDFLRLKGHQADRVDIERKIYDNRRVVTDVIGHHRSIGTVQYFKYTTQPDTANISANIAGRLIRIGIKYAATHDGLQSWEEEHQRHVESAGSAYWVVTSFVEFLDHYYATFGGSDDGQGAKQ